MMPVRTVIHGIKMTPMIRTAILTTESGKIMPIPQLTDITVQNNGEAKKIISRRLHERHSDKKALFSSMDRAILFGCE